MIINEYPPNYEEIKKVFDIENENVIFTYGENIYNPKKLEIHNHLLIHEYVHSKQQKETGIKDWWEKYLADKIFRLEQETKAYQAQYRYAKEFLNDEGRKIFLDSIASDLSSKIYGNMISHSKAETLIRKKA